MDVASDEPAGYRNDTHGDLLPHEHVSSSSSSSSTHEESVGGGGGGDGAGTTGHVPQITPALARGRRQSNTGELQKLVEAWPEGRARDNNDKNNNNNNNNVNSGGRGSPHQSASCRKMVEVEANPERRRLVARALLSDRALLAGVFRQLAGANGPQARDGLDKRRMVQLFRYPRMPVDVSQQEAEGLAEAVLAHCGGTSTARFSSLAAFLAKQAGQIAAEAVNEGSFEGHQPAVRDGVHSPLSRANEKKKLLQDDPIAQSIRRTVLEGRSELRLAGGDAESRLSCAVHLRRAFRHRRKTLGGDPGVIDDCSVGASDLPGVLQDMGVMLNATQTAFLMKKCGARQTPRGRPVAGGKDEAPVRAGDLLAFFRELLTVR